MEKIRKENAARQAAIAADIKARQDAEVE